MKEKNYMNDPYETKELASAERRAAKGPQLCGENVLKVAVYQTVKGRKDQEFVVLGSQPLTAL